jgi:hypothetical protein
VFLKEQIYYKTMVNFVVSFSKWHYMKHLHKTIWIVFFALAMGYLESAVVVYLRELYYPEGFNFPLKLMTKDIAVTELYREAATLIMILAVSVLAAEIWLHRFAWFLVIFSIWDIAYYLFLKVLVGWPSSLLTTDILFLLPSIWTGPVIAPIINSLIMILLALVILNNTKGSKPVVRLSNLAWALLIIGSLIVLIAYMKDYAGYVIEYRNLHSSGETGKEEYMMILPLQFIPRSFDWLLFCAGICMHLTAILLISIRKRKISVQ